MGTVAEAPPSRASAPEEAAGPPNRFGNALTGAWRWWSTHEDAVMATGMALAVAIALWLTSGAWGGRPPAGEDTMAHLARTEFALRHLVSDARVDGWYPGFILGYQEFLFIGPGFTWAVAVVRVLSLGLLSVPGAFKVVVIGSFVVLPLAVAFAARSFGLSRRATGVAAILTLAVNNPFGGVGVQGLFNVGLVTHTFGAIFFFVALGGIVRTLREPRARWTVLTALALAVLLMSHGISVMVLAVIGVLVVITLVVASLALPSLRRDDLSTVVRQEVRAQLAALGLTAKASTVGDADHVGDAMPAAPAEPVGSGGVEAGPEDDIASDAAEQEPGRLPITGETLKHLFYAGAAAAGLAACVLLPFYGHRDLRGIYTAWAVPPLGERIRQIWEGEYLFRPGVSLFVAAGLIYALAQAFRGRRLALALVAVPILYLILAHAALYQWRSSVFATQLPTRGMGYFGVLLVLPLAALIAHASRPFAAAGGALALAVAAAIAVIPLGPTRDLAKQVEEPIPQVKEAARQLQSVVPNGARFMTERDFPTEIERTRLVNPDRWLAWASDRWTLNNFNVESSTAPGPAYESEHVDDRPPEALADAVSKLGVTHVVTVSDASAAHLIASPRFAPVWQQSPIAIFSVSARPRQPQPSSLLATDAPAQAQLVRAEPESLEIRVSASQATRATIAVGWSPKWHAEVSGRDVPLRKAADGMLELNLPAGESRLTLDFKSDGWDRLGVFVTLLTIVCGATWIRRRWEARRWEERPHTAGGSGDEEPAGEDAGSLEPVPDHGPEGADPVPEVGPQRR